jgi:hypothetical protein
MSRHPSYDNHLVVTWSKRERDLVLGGPCGPDRHLIHAAFCGYRSFDGRTFVEELERRGYLIETLRFSCKRNRASNEPDPRKDPNHGEET